MKTINLKISLTLAVLLAYAAVLTTGCSDDATSPGGENDQDDDVVVAASEYPLVDTGQTSCFNDEGLEITAPSAGESFYGQDAQFTGASFSFTDNGDGTVTDNNTGLVWQQTPSSVGYSWQDAMDYCDDLELAEKSDWRAPTLKELFSISDFSQGWPYLDTEYFDLVDDVVSKDEQYWADNFYFVGTTHGGQDSAFGVNHGTGHIKAYPAGASGPMGNYVRAVSGQIYGTNGFIDNGDGTITDEATGLMWMQDDAGTAVDWEDALAYAESLSLGGHDDWRLPDVRELQGIVDYSGVFPAIDALFACTAITNEAGDADFGYYWSNTSAYFGTESPEYYYAWYVAFGYAVDGDGNDSHGAGAVRFDTKVEGGPLGEGGERYYNHVRCVRSVDSDNPSDPVGTNVIVDTDQSVCYDNQNEITAPDEGESFYGQDAQLAGAQPSYVVSGDGLTVYDEVTGLTWVRSPDTDGDGELESPADKLTWAEAQSYPATLNAAEFGGFADWRLPTIKELYSLIMFSGEDVNPESLDGAVPFIDTDAFTFVYGNTNAMERVIDSQYASSTLYVADSAEGQLLFGVNFADGRIKGYGLTMPGGMGDKTFFVQCVRGNSDYGTNVFVDNGDGTVTDEATGLMWAQDDSGAESTAGLNWEEALAWVATRNSAGYLGFNDWRLPNVKELQSIVDYSRSPATTGSAAIDPVFNATAITNEAGAVDYAFYWSGTTHANSLGGQNAAYVAFGRSLGYMNGSWVDVHGAGSQRSDPKVGDPADYPTGHGPQGDAIRIYNLVRLVRGE